MEMHDSHFDSRDETTEEPGSLHYLDAELARLGAAIDDLEKVLTPVTSQYALAEKAADAPRPEPRSQLRGRVERLAEHTSRVQRVRAELDL